MEGGETKCNHQNDNDVPENTTTEDHSLVSKPNDTEIPYQQRQRSRPWCDWILLFVCSACNSVLVGYTSGLAVLFLDMKWSFQSTRAEASMVQSLNTGLMFGGGIISSFITSLLNAGTVCSLSAIVAGVVTMSACFLPSLPLIIIVVGVVGGLSMCVIFTSLFIVIGRIFKDNYNLALSMIIFGGGLGSFIFPYLNGFLVEMYGWRGTYLILAGLVFNCLPVGLLLRAMLSKDSTSYSLRKKCLDNPFFQSQVSLWKDPLFVTFFVCLILRSVPIGLLTYFMLDIAVYKNFDTETGTLFLTVLGLGNLGGRLLTLVTRSCVHIQPVKEYAICIIVSGLAILFLGLSESYSLIMCICVIFGIAYGMLSSTAGIAVYSIAGESRYATALGIFNTGIGVGFGIAGPIGGAVKDRVESYNHVLFGFAVVSLTAGVLLLIMALIRTKDKRKSEIK